MGCSSSKHSKNNDQLRSIGSASSPTAATNGGLSGITYTSRSSNNTTSRRNRSNNNNYDDNISIPTIDSDYNPHNSNFSLSDAGGTVGSQSRLSHGMTISSSHNNNNMMTINNNHSISAFGSQLSPSIAPNDDEEEDSIERRLYQDVYMRESQNNNMMYSMTLSHLIQPPTTTRTYNTATNINATNNNNGHSYNHNNGGRGMKEETIVIIAPKGKLGVVIDTPTINNINNNTGKTTMPIVHAIKDTCPIRSQIRVGDKLLAVDDEDVTYMTAVEVSRLIGRKCEQKERKLTIVRGGGGRGGVIY